jgi:hypothetical protein
MRSHHAPTRCLLERFSFRDAGVRGKKKVWVYEKGSIPRATSNFRGESAEHAYFAGSSDSATEEEIEARLNQNYEAPFNALLPSFDRDVHLFESKEVRRICAEYVSNLFQRCKARREGANLLMTQEIHKIREIARSGALLRLEAAKDSIFRRGPIYFDELKQAIEQQVEKALSASEEQRRFVDDVDRSTKFLADQLQDLQWSILGSDSRTEFVISDTPVVSMAFDQKGGRKFGVGVRNPAAEWYLPIAPWRVLRMKHKLSPERLSALHIRPAINMAQVLTSHRRVYSRSKSVEMDSLVQTHGSTYKFHVHVFKGSFDESTESRFDQSFADV